MPDPIGNPEADFILQGVANLGLQDIEQQLQGSLSQIQRITQAIDRAAESAQAMGRPFETASTSFQRMASGIETASQGLGRLSERTEQVVAANGRIQAAYQLQQQTLRTLDAAITTIRNKPIIDPSQFTTLRNLETEFRRIEAIQPSQLLTTGFFNPAYVQGLLTQVSRFNLELTGTDQKLKQIASVQKELVGAGKISGIAGIEIPPEATAALEGLIEKITRFGAVSQAAINETLVGWRQYITTIKEAQAAIISETAWEEQSGAREMVAVRQITALRERLTAELNRQQLAMAKLAAVGPGQQLGTADLEQMATIRAKLQSGRLAINSIGTDPEDLERLQLYRTTLAETDIAIKNLQASMAAAATEEKQWRSIEVKDAAVREAQLKEEAMLLQRLGGAINTQAMKNVGVGGMGMTEAQVTQLKQYNLELARIQQEYLKIAELGPAAFGTQGPALAKLDLDLKAVTRDVANLSGAIAVSNDTAKASASAISKETDLRLKLERAIQNQIIATKELMGPRFGPSAAARAGLEAQLKELEAMQAALKGPVGTGQGLLPGSMGMNAAAIAQMEESLKKLKIAFGGIKEEVPQVRSVFDALFGGFTRYIRIAMQLTVVYGTMRMAMDALRELGTIDRAMAKMEIVMGDQVDKTQKLGQAYQAMLDVQRITGMGFEKAGELVFDLTKAFEDQTLAAGSAHAAALLLSLGELNLNDVTRLLSGTYNTFGQQLNQSLSPTEKLNTLMAQALASANLSAGSLKDFAMALQQVGGIAGVSDVEFAKVTTTLSLMLDALKRARMSGTEFRQALVDMQVNAKNLNQVFGLGLDLSKPFDVMDMLIETVKRLRQSIETEGRPTAAQMESLMQTFSNKQSLDFMLAMVGVVDQYADRLRKAREAGPEKIAEGNEKLAKSVTSESTRIWTEFIDGLERMIGASSGVPVVTGRYENLAAALNKVANAMHAVMSAGEFFAKLLAIPEPELTPEAEKKWRRLGVPEEFFAGQPQHGTFRDVGSPKALASAIADFENVEAQTKRFIKTSATWLMEAEDQKQLANYKRIVAGINEEYDATNRTLDITQRLAQARARAGAANAAYLAGWKQLKDTGTIPLESGDLAKNEEARVARLQELGNKRKQARNEELQIQREQESAEQAIANAIGAADSSLAQFRADAAAMAKSKILPDLSEEVTQFDEKMRKRLNTFAREQQAISENFKKLGFDAAGVTETRMHVALANIQNEFISTARIAQDAFARMRFERVMAPLLTDSEKFGLSILRNIADIESLASKSEDVQMGGVTIPGRAAATPEQIDAMKVRALEMAVGVDKARESLSLMLAQMGLVGGEAGQAALAVKAGAASFAELEQMAQGVIKVSPLVQQMFLTAQQSSIALGAGAESFVQLEAMAAGTIQPTKDVVKALTDAGVSSENFRTRLQAMVEQGKSLSAFPGYAQGLVTFGRVLGQVLDAALIGKMAEGIAATKIEINALASTIGRSSQDAIMASAAWTNFHQSIEEIQTAAQSANPVIATLAQNQLLTLSAMAASQQKLKDTQLAKTMDDQRVATLALGASLVMPTLQAAEAAKAWDHYRLSLEQLDPVQRDLIQQFARTDQVFSDAKLLQSLNEQTRSLEGQREALRLIGPDAEAVGESWARYGMRLQQLTPVQQLMMEQLAELRTRLRELSAIQGLKFVGFNEEDARQLARANTVFDDFAKKVSDGTKALEDFNTRGEKAEQAALEAIAQNARYAGDALTYVSAKFAEAGTRGTYFFDTLGTLAESTAKGMSSSLNDYFFDEMDGKVANFKTLGESMFTSLKKSAAAFMSDTVIHGFTSLFSDALKEVSPGLADMFKGVMGVGKGPAAEVEKAVKPLLDLKELFEKLREESGLTATALQEHLITPIGAGERSITAFSAALDLAVGKLKTFAESFAAMPQGHETTAPAPSAPTAEAPPPPVPLETSGLNAEIQNLEAAGARLTATVSTVADLLPQVPVTLQQSAGQLTTQLNLAAQSTQSLVAPDQNLKISMELLKDEIGRSASQLSTDLIPDVSATGNMLSDRLTPAGDSTTEALRQLIIQIDLAAAALRNLGQSGGGVGGGGAGLGDIGGAISSVSDLATTAQSLEDVNQSIADFENSTESLNRSFGNLGSSIADFEFDAEAGLSGMTGATETAARIIKSSSQSTSTSLLDIGKSLMPLVGIGGSLIALTGAMKAGNVQGAALSGAGLITSSAQAIDSAAKIVAKNAEFFGESTTAFANQVTVFMKSMSPLLTGITFASSLFGLIQNIQQGNTMGATLSGISTLTSGISLGMKVWPYIAEYASKLSIGMGDIVTILGNGAKLLGATFTKVTAWVVDMFGKGMTYLFESFGVTAEGIFQAGAAGMQGMEGISRLGGESNWSALFTAIGPALKIIANVVAAAFSIYGAITADNDIERAIHSATAVLFIAAAATIETGVGVVLAAIGAIIEVVDAILGMFGVFSGPSHYLATRIRALNQAQTGLGKLGPVYEAAAGGTPAQVLGALQTGEMDQHIRATLYLPPEIARDLGLIAATDKTQLEWTQLNARQFDKLIDIYAKRPELIGMVGGSGDVPYLSQEQAQNLANIVARGAQTLINTLLLERAPKEQQTPEGLDLLMRWEEQVSKLTSEQVVKQFAGPAGLDMSKLMVPAVPTPEDLHARLVAGGIDAASAVEEAYRAQYEAWAAASKEDASAQPPDLAGMLAKSGLADSIVEWVMAGLQTSQFRPDVQAMLNKLGPGAGTQDYLKLFTQLNPDFAASNLGGILYGLVGNRTGITPGQGGLSEANLERIQSILDELATNLGRALTGAGTTKEIRGFGGEGEKLLTELNALIQPAIRFAGVTETTTKKLNDLLDAARTLITAITDAAAKFEPSREQARAETYLPDQVASEYVNKFLAPMQMAGGLLVASIAPLKEKIQPTVDAIAALKDRIKALQDVGVDTADLDAQLKALQAEIAPTEQQLVPLQQALDKIQKQITDWTALIDQEGVVQADIAKLTFNQIDQLSLGAKDFGRTLQANVQDIKNNRKILDLALRGTSAADVTKAAQDTAKGIMDTYQALSNYLQGLEKQLADLFDKVGVPLVNLKIALAETELAAHGTGTQFRALVTALSAVAAGARDVEVRSFAATEGIAAISAAITGMVGRITGTTLADLGGMRPEEPVAASTYSRLASSIMDAATASIPFIRAFEQMASKSEQLGDYTAALKQLGEEQTALLGLQKSVVQGMRDLQKAVADVLKDFGKPLVDLRVLVATNTMAVTGSASGFRDLIDGLESTITATDNVQVKAFAAAQGLSVLGAELTAIAEMPTPVTFEDLTAGLTAVATEAGTFTSTLESLATAAENAGDFQKALDYLDQERSGLIALADAAIGAIKSWETAAIEAARKAGDAQKKVYEAQKKVNQDQIDALSTQLSAIKELDSAFDSVTKMIGELRSGGQATPAESLIYAQAEFQRRVAAFQRATPENRTGAAQNVQDAARTLLDILKQAFTPGSNDYLRVYNQVLAGLGTVARGLQGAGAGTGDTIQAQINVLQDVNKGIDDLITQVDTDTEAVIAGITNQATTLIAGVKTALGEALTPLGDHIGTDVGLIVTAADDAYAELVKINNAINLQLAALGIRMGGDLTKSAQALQDAIFAITGGLESQAFLALMAKLSTDYLRDIRDDLDAFLQLAGPISGRQPGQVVPTTKEEFLTAVQDFALTPDSLKAFLTTTKQSLNDVLHALLLDKATLTAEQESFLRAIANIIDEPISETWLSKLLPREPEPGPHTHDAAVAGVEPVSPEPGPADTTAYETAIASSTDTVNTNTSAFEGLTATVLPTQTEFEALAPVAAKLKSSYLELQPQVDLLASDFKDLDSVMTAAYQRLHEQVAIATDDFKLLNEMMAALLAGQPAPTGDLPQPILSAVPSFGSGGLVQETGLIYAHAGETVIPPGGGPSLAPASNSTSVYLNFSPGAVVITGVRDAKAASDAMMARVYREAASGDLGKVIGNRYARSRP